MGRTYGYNYLDVLLLPGALPSSPVHSRHNYSQTARLRGLAAADEVKHVLDDLLGRRDVPQRERALRAVPHSGGEDRAALNREVDGLEPLALPREERDGERGLEADALVALRLGLLGLGLGEEEERAEHVLVGLVVAGAEDELGVGVGVQDALDDLALVDGERAHFEVLLADEDCMWTSAYTPMEADKTGMRTLDWPLACEVVLEQILTLVTLEETGTRYHQHPTYLEL